MRVLFLGDTDYSLSGHGMAEALRTQGIETKVLVQRRGSIDYGKPIRTSATVDEYAAEIQWADVVHVIQGDLPSCLGGEYPPQAWIRNRKRLLLSAPVLRRKPPDARRMDLLHGKPVVLQVGNSFVREIPAYYRGIWKGMALHTIHHAADTMGYGLTPEECLVVPPIPAGLGYVPREPHDQLVVGHFPTKPQTKGSPEILYELDANARRLYLDVRRPRWDPRRGCALVPWERQIARMAACDVYVDQIQPVLNGVRFGEFCSAAIEAAALGCVTIANSLVRDPYEESYGQPPPLWRVKSVPEMVDLLESCPRGEELVEYQETVADRCQALHSLENTGRVLVERVYGRI